MCFTHKATISAWKCLSQHISTEPSHLEDLSDLHTPPKTFTIIHKHVQTHTQMPASFLHAALKLMAGSFKGIIRCSEWAIMCIRLIQRRQVICLSDRYKHPLQTNQHFNIKPMFHCITKPPGCTQDYSINERKSQNLRKIRFFQLRRREHYC